MPSEVERYQRAADQCTAKAEHSATVEIGELWLSIAASYNFLLRREERLLAQERERFQRLGPNTG